jgi:rhodanese-related sulfurtransferase
MVSLTLATILLALSSSLTPGGVASAAAFTTTANSHAGFSVGRGSNLRRTELRAQAQPEHIQKLCANVCLGGTAFLIDVRELDEGTAGHLAEACSAPLSTLSAGRWMDKMGEFHPGTFPIDPFTGVAMKQNANIYVHCAMGGRASKAAELFTSMGYSNVTPLAEGFQELAAMEVSAVFTGEPNALTD